MAKDPEGNLRVDRLKLTRIFNLLPNKAFRGNPKIQFCNGRTCDENRVGSLLYILLLAFFIRVTLSLVAFLIHKDKTVFYLGDSIEYIDCAFSLIKQGQFTREGLPEIIRTPGYPLMLIPGLLLENVELVTIGVQILLSCLTIYLVFRIALLIFEERQTAIFAAALYAVEPIAVLNSSFLMTETLFTAMIALFTYFLTHYVRRISLRYLASSALILAASVFVRPAGYFLPAVITVCLGIWASFQKSKRAVILMHTAIFFLFSMAPIALWQVRNCNQTSYCGFAAVKEFSLYFYNSGAVQAEINGVPFLDFLYDIQATYFEDHPDQRAWKHAQVYEYMGREWKSPILNNPLVYLKIHARGSLIALLEPGISYYGGLLGFNPGTLRDLWSKVSTKSASVADVMLILFRLILEGIIVTLLGLAVLGLSGWTLSNRFQITLLVILVCYFLIIAPVEFAGSRFRLPATPFICVLAGHGLTQLKKQLQQRFSRLTQA